MSSVCAFTSVCEEDACWLPQWLAEVDRLHVPFVVHFDRCSTETVMTVGTHRLCVGTTRRDDPLVEFTEQHKQETLDTVVALGYDWALAWDVDETFELDVLRKIDLLTRMTYKSLDWLDVRWLNLWGDENHVRVDGTFAQGHRVKLLNLRKQSLVGQPLRWGFDHPITNGPKLMTKDGVVVESKGASVHLVCLHHGMMTEELRRFKKERWDRIYSKALRGDPNPYGFWRSAIETEAQAVTVRHGYR